MFDNFDFRIKTKIYFYVPFNKKDDAKAKGMRWNPDMKLWYILYVEEFHDYEDYLKKPKYIYDKFSHIFNTFKYHSFENDYAQKYCRDEKDLEEYSKLYDNADKYFTQIYFINEHKNEQKQKKINNKELQFMEE